MFKDNFQKCLDIEVVKVEPITKTVHRNENLSTETRVWLECGPYHSQYMTHDLDLDCSGATFEEAIIELANLVQAYYNDVGEKRDV